MTEPTANSELGPTGRPEDSPAVTTGRRVDEAWAVFRRLVAAFPAERLGERPADGGWTRKQMLAHVAAWHDLTSDRLARFVVSGAKVPLTEEVDAVNARVARSAEGRTAGEIIQWLDDSQSRLRRLAGRLSARPDGRPRRLGGGGHRGQHLRALHRAHTGARTSAA